MSNCCNILGQVPKDLSVSRVCSKNGSICDLKDGLQSNDVTRVNRLFIQNVEYTQNIIDQILGCLQHLTIITNSGSAIIDNCEINLNSLDVWQTSALADLIQFFLQSGNNVGDIILWDGSNWIISNGLVAQNGLTLVSTRTVELGGTLLHDTNITTEGFRQEFVTNSSIGIDTTGIITLPNSMYVFMKPGVPNMTTPPLTFTQNMLLSGTSGTLYQPVVRGNRVHVNSANAIGGFNFRIMQFIEQQLVTLNTRPWTSILPFSTSTSTADVQFRSDWNCGTGTIFTVNSNILNSLDMRNGISPKRYCIGNFTTANATITTWAGTTTETYNLLTYFNPAPSSFNLTGLFNKVARSQIVGPYLMCFNQNAGGGTTPWLIMMDASNPGRPYVASTTNMNLGVQPIAQPNESLPRYPQVSVGAQTQTRVRLVNYSNPYSVFVSAFGNVTGSATWSTANVVYLSECVYATTRILSNRVDIYRVTPVKRTVAPAATSIQLIGSNNATGGARTVTVLLNTIICGGSTATGTRRNILLNIQNFAAPYVVRTSVVNSDIDFASMPHGRELPITVIPLGGSQNLIQVMDLGGTSSECVESGKIWTRTLQHSNTANFHDLHIQGDFIVNQSAKFNDFGLMGRLRYHPFKSNDTIIGISQAEQMRMGMTIRAETDTGLITWGGYLHPHKVNVTVATSTSYPSTIVLPFSQATTTFTNTGALLRTYPQDLYPGGASGFFIGPGYPDVIVGTVAQGITAGSYIEWQNVPFGVFNNITNPPFPILPVANYQFHLRTSTNVGAGQWRISITGTALLSAIVNVATNAQLTNIFTVNNIPGGLRTVRLSLTTAGAGNNLSVADGELLIVQI